MSDVSKLKKFIQQEIKKHHKISLLEGKKAQIEKKLKMLNESEVTGLTSFGFRTPKDSGKNEYCVIEYHGKYRDYNNPSQINEHIITMDDYKERIVKNANWTKVRDNLTFQEAKTTLDNIRTKNFKRK